MLGGKELHLSLVGASAKVVEMQNVLTVALAVRAQEYWCFAAGSVVRTPRARRPREETPFDLLALRARDDASRHPRWGRITLGDDCTVGTRVASHGRHSLASSPTRILGQSSLIVPPSPTTHSVA